MNKQLLLLISLLLPLVAMADDSGSCGTDVTYTYESSTGTLTIQGSGAMYDYSNSSNAPWYSYRTGIKTIVIKDGVTSIGGSAFGYCSGLTSIAIPDGVTSIGGSAFQYCISLTSVAIGNNVTSIGDYAFYQCTGLTSIEIPNSMTSIGGSAFGYCSGLTSIAIPDGVTSIGGSAFSGCYGLTSIEIPNSVTSIGDNAFLGCSGLSNVKVPVTDYSAFCNNAVVGLIASKIGKPVELIDEDGNEIKEYVIPEDVTSIGYNAFYNCSGLTSITIGNSVTSIGSSAFYYCSGLTSIEIPNSVTSIRSEAFRECRGLTSITIGNSVTSIGEFAFSGCSGLSNVKVPVTDYSAFCNNAVVGLIASKIGMLVKLIDEDGNEIKEYVIPEDVKSIGGSVFRNCSGLTSVIIPNSVTSIGDWAFSWCSCLTSVTIPNSVTSIGGSAFSGCRGLTSITIPNSVTSIGVQTFSGCSGLTSITIGNGVTSIGDDAFSNCTGLTSVTIPNSVTSIGNYAFYNTAWYNNKPNGLVYAGKVAYKYKGTMPDNTNITIKEGTLGIAGGAFRDCTGLTSITIPNSVTSIGDLAFYFCSGLTSVTIPNSVTSIGNSAFYNCSGLTSIEIPNSVTTIGNYAFYGCSNLTSVTVKLESPITITFSTFSNRTNATLHVPSSSVNLYRTTAPWSGFKEVVAISGEKCATPTISFKGGKLHFECETPDVTYHYTITPPSKTDNTGNDVEVGSSYTVQVYASKDGYLNSDTATQDIDIRGLKGDVNDDGDVTAQDASLILQKVAGKIDW